MARSSIHVPESTVQQDEDSSEGLDYEDDVTENQGEDQVDLREVLNDKCDKHGDDVGQDEVWEQQQRIMEHNREKRDRIKKRLERQRQLAHERLREEEEKEELERMEREIKELNQKRSVEAHVSRGKKGTRTLHGRGRGSAPAKTSKLNLNSRDRSIPHNES